MNITIDIGNTYIKTCVFHNDNIIYQDRKQEYTKEDIETLSRKYNLKNCIISSVRDNNTKIETYLKEENVNVIHLHLNMSLPLKIIYDTPHTLGQDRVAAAVGAASLFDNTNLIVIDIGTCITYDFVSSEGYFLGGNIAPGYKMRLDAMHHFTGKLPLINITADPIPAVGNNTTNAIKAGAYYGILHEIKGTIDDAKNRTEKDFKVIITGGAAECFAKDFDSQFTIEPNLVHIGLNNILKHTDENKR